MEVYEFMLDLNRDVVKEIIESREDVRNNKDLTSLVDVYFKNTSKTLDFCNTVQNCVKIAENSRLIIRYAVKQFEAESEDAKRNNAEKRATARMVERFPARTRIRKGGTSRVSGETTGQRKRFARRGLTP